MICRSICFSQYVTFLDLIKWRLEKAGFKVCRLNVYNYRLCIDSSIQSLTSIFLLDLNL